MNVIQGFLLQKKENSCVGKAESNYAFLYGTAIYMSVLIINNKNDKCNMKNSKINKSKKQH